MRLSLVLLAGCHATTSLEPPPAPSSARTMILMAQAEDYRVAYAIELPEDGSAPVFPTFNRPTEIDLFAATFGCPLDVLGMEPGRLGFLEEPARRIELPSPLSVLSSHDGAAQSEWAEVEVSAAESILRALVLPDDNLCRLYSVALAPLDVSFRVSETSTPTALIPLPNGNVLVAHGDRTFYEVKPDRTSVRYPALDGAPNDAGFIRADGSVVLVERDGTIAQGDPDTGYTILQTRTATTHELIFAGGSRTDELEVFRVSFGGPFERWTAATGWVMLTDGGAQFVFGNYALAVLGPGEAIATGVVDGTNSAFRYKDGDLIEEQVPGSHVPLAIADIPGIGLVIGTDEGDILFYDDGRFEPRTGSVIDSQARAILPTERGFLYGRTTWASWDPVGGHCPQNVGSTDASRAAILGDRNFLLLENLTFDRFRQTSVLLTLDRQDFEHSCLGK